MKRRTRLSDSIQTVDVNISPLIDMMFLLLIFFIVTTAFVEEIGVPIQKPTAASAQSLDAKSIILGISGDGRIYYGDKEIGLNNVRGTVSRLLQGETKPVIIMADEASRSKTLVDVIDECKLAGAQQVSVATETE
jgi:biopolymer transport protein ExbD